MEMELFKFGPEAWLSLWWPLRSAQVQFTFRDLVRVLILKAVAEISCDMNSVPLNVHWAYMGFYFHRNMFQIFRLILVIFGEYRMERALLLVWYYYVCLSVCCGERGLESTSNDPESCAVSTSRTSLAGGAKREKSD